MLLAAMLLAACSDDTPDTSAEVAEIRFRADAGQVMEGTRATTISSNSELQSQELRIDAYFHGTTTPYFSNALLDFQSSAWGFYQSVGGTQLHYYWPIEGSVETASSINVGSLDFIGYCPYSLDNTCVTLNSYGNGSLSFSCTLPMTNATLEVEETGEEETGEGKTTQANLKEFLCAYQPNQTKATNSGTVNMTFKHPFARIYFKLSAASGGSVSINSVTIAGVKNNGSCTFDGTTSSWTPSGDATDLVVTGTPATGDTPYLVLPQTFDSNLTFTVNATWSSWSNVTKNVSASVDVGSWAAGTSYTYTFTLKEDALIVDTSKFTEQW